MLCSCIGLFRKEEVSVRIAEYVLGVFPMGDRAVGKMC